MPLMSHEMLRTAAAALIVGLAGAAASPAHAVTRTLPYTCTYDLLGAQPLLLEVEASFPETVVAGAFTEPVRISVTATAGGDTHQGFRLIASKRLEGTATIGLNAPGYGAANPLAVPVALDPVRFDADAPSPSEDLVLTGGGTVAPMRFPAAGPARISVRSLEFHLQATGVDGRPPILPPDGTEVPPPGESTSPIGASCTFTGETSELATIAVSAAPAPPTITQGIAPSRAQPGDQILIAGRDLAGAEVAFGPTPANAQANGAGTELTVTVPGGTAGSSVEVSVSAHGRTASAGTFTFAPAPALSLRQRCDFPLLGRQPVVTDLDLRTPATFANRPTGRIPLDLVVALREPIAQGFQLIGAATVEGTIRLGVSIDGAGLSRAEETDLTITRVGVGSATGDVVLRATGSLPSFTPLEPGTAAISVDRFTMILTPRNAAGAPIELSPVYQEAPAAWPATCVLDPVGQDATLASLAVGPSKPDEQPPTAPGNLAVESTDRSTATLRWDDAEDDIGVMDYQVSYDGKTETTSATGLRLTGLERGATYSASVRARDYAGNLSAASTVTFTSAAPDTRPPTRPSELKATATQSTIYLTWERSVDDEDYVLHEVFVDGELATSTEGSGTYVVQLRGASTYTIKVRGRDRAGNTSEFSSDLAVTTVASSAPDGPFRDPDLFQAAQCAYPFFQDRPATLSFKSDLPTRLTRGVPIGPAAVSAALVSMAPGFLSSDVKTIEGVATVATTVRAPGFERTDEVSLDMLAQPWPAGANPWTAPVDLELRGRGSLASFTLPQSGAGAVTVDQVRLTLIVRDAAGDPIILPPGAGPDLDGDPATLHVSCTPDPAQQSTVLHAFTVDDERSSTYGYDFAGSATLKTLTRGTVPLAGAVDATLDRATGDLKAAVTFAPVTAQLTALRFLPVTARVMLVPSGATTGSLTDRGWSSTTKVRIKLPEIRVFGVPLAGGDRCQTRTVTNLVLKSTGASFDPLAGGSLAGGFAISDLTGCGFLTGLVSPLTAGQGNAIAVKVAPRG